MSESIIETIEKLLEDREIIKNIPIEKLRGILSVVTPESIKYTKILDFVFWCREIGIELNNQNRNALLIMANKLDNKENKVDLLNASFDLVDSSISYADDLISLLPDYPVAKLHILLDKLKLLAQKQNAALLTYGKSIRTPNDILYCYESIMKIKKDKIDNGFQNLLFYPLEKVSLPIGNLMGVIHDMRLYINSKIIVLSNMNPDIKAIHSRIFPKALLSNVGDKEEYLKVSYDVNATISEYDKTKFSAKSYGIK